MDVTQLVLGIHDLNPWGGQERSNLEIFYRLNAHFPVELHAYSFSDNRPWQNLEHVSYSRHFRSPILLKMHHYQLQSFLSLQKRHHLFSGRKKNGVLIQSTGTALTYSDVVQVQFVHKTWHDISRQLDTHVHPSNSFLRSAYDHAFDTANLVHEKALYTNSKKYIAISHSIKKELMTHYNIRPENIEVIYHGVEAESFPSRFEDSSRFARKQIRHQYGIPEDTFVLLTVGALNTRKGLHIIFETLRELVSNGVDNIVVLAVGAGPADHYQSKLSQWNLNDYVRFAPAQKAIAPYYQASDIFFFPSLYEPFGLVILEAMASALAVVTSSVSGAAELITPGRDGIVVDAFGSPTEIASEIAQLIKNKDALENLGKRACETASRHSWGSVAKNYLEFYNTGILHC